MSNAFRNSKIDFLRGLAILVVLILHFNISYGLDQSALTSIFSASFIKVVASNGNYGVTIFFVISGFLITSTSLARYGALGRIDVVGFYIYRFARIMPCLLLVLGLTTVLNFLHVPIFQNDPNSTSFSLAIFSVLTFWHNILMEKVGYFNYCLNILWSLSVEEVFYLVFPLMCLMFKRTRFMLMFWAVLVIVAPIFRSYYADNEIIALYGYFSCFDAIAIGCIAAVIAQYVRLVDWMRTGLLCGAGLLIGGVYFYSGIMANVVFGPSVIALGAAIYLVSASSGKAEDKQPVNWFTRIICWFGMNSYELYLFHIIVLALMKEMVSPELLGNYTKLLWFVLFVAITALVAGVVSSFYSQPMNKMLRNSIHPIRWGRAGQNMI